MVRCRLVLFLLARPRLVCFLRFSPCAGVTSWVRHLYDSGRKEFFGDSPISHLDFCIINARHVVCVHY